MLNCNKGVSSQYISYRKYSSFLINLSVHGYVSVLNDITSVTIKKLNAA